MRALYGRWLIILAIGVSLPWSAWAYEHAQEDWQALHPANHPLLGKIWDVTGGRFMPPAALYHRLQRAHFVLLGEVHSNPDHHRLQQRVIESLASHGRRPAVVFEMFERSHQPIIERLRGRYSDAADRIARQTAMDGRGWRWRLYKPLVEAVLAHDLPLFGADLSRLTVREIVEEGLETLGAERIQSLGLDEPLAPRVADAMRADIVASHCGFAPETLIEGMMAAQRARDASLADVLIAHAGYDGAVLIAGSGHVREDWGVPIYLHRRAPGKTIFSVALVEVVASKVRPEAYVPAIPDEQPPFDYLWFTPGGQADDSCEQFEERLRKLDQTSTPNQTD